MITPDDIVAEARTWIGTPWRHQARVKGVGVDCIGFVGGVGVALGLSEALEWRADRSLRGYGRTPVPETLLDACDRFLDRVPLTSQRMGDVLVMGFTAGPQHFAIVSRREPECIIHAYAQRRAVVETPSDLPGAQVLRAYRFRGVA